ncbi:hypothetical protein OAU50_08665 [Planctomycetota bacterium]|nr:hypothetical protein [Planctomycetota bacterium]
MKIVLLATLLVSAIGVAAVLLMPADDPAFNHMANRPCDPETDTPRDADGPSVVIPKIPDGPEPSSNAVGPKTPEDIEIWLEGVYRAMNHIRSRVEYKYQTSGREIAKEWTIAELVRRAERAESQHFMLTDFSLTYESEPEPAFCIHCTSSHGKALTSGPLTMTVKFGSGRTEYKGYPYAVAANGGVLLSDEAMAELIRFTHAEIILEVTTFSVSEFRRRVLFRRSKGFSQRMDLAKDVVVSRLDGKITFSVESIGSIALAETITGTYDAKQGSWTRNHPNYIPKMPTSNEDIGPVFWLDLYVQHARYADAGELVTSKGTWEWAPISMLPCDVQITNKDEVYTANVVSSWGRKLPFEGPSASDYPNVEDGDEDEKDYEDE